MSGSVDTFASWATHVTKCSNPTFDIVVNRLWSNPKMQKDVLAVLAGVTKLIQSRNGTESAAEYYAALLSLLNTDSSTKSAEAYLLRLVVCKAVPVSLLRKTCSESSKTLTNVLMAALQEEPLDISLCKSVLLALGRVLAAQSSDSWSSESVRHTYRIFLQFVDHENPTIRKTCQTAVLEILTSSLSQEGIHHPVCHQTVSHLCTLVRQERNHLSTLIRTTDESFGRILRCLNLLKSALPLVPEKDVKAGCECALELTEIPNSLVVKAAFECLQAVFSGCAKEDSLPLEMAGKLMSAIFTCRPQEPSAVESAALQKETESMTCWLNCLRNGVAFLTTFILNSATTSPDLAINVAIEHFEHLVKLAFLLVVNTPVPGLREVARDILLALFADQLNTLLQHGGFLEHRPRLLPDICLSIQSALNLSRREAWPHLLRITSQLFRIWPSALPEFAVFQPDLTLPPEVTGLIVHVANVRDALVDGAGANDIGVMDTKDTGLLIDEMDRLILIALESWGIEVVLKDALPLHPLLDELESGSVELRRSWLLPLLARARPSRPCSLAFFFTTLLPLADRGVAVAKAAAANNFSRKMGASGGGRGGSRPFVPLSAILNAGVILARQIWEVLLTFTRKPPARWSDLIDSGLGGRLVNGLINSKAVRPIILSALRRLVSFANTDEAIKVMRVGARQMVPRILSLYEEQESTNDQQLKQQLRATLLAFFPLLTSKMLSVPYEMAFQKLKSTGRPIYMEIIQLIVPHLEEEKIKSLLLSLEIYLTPETETPALRKPSYRVLEAVVSSNQPEAELFVRHNLTSLISLMSKITPKKGASEPSPKNPDVLCSNLAELTVSTGPLRKSAKASGKIPWKSRFRILRCLLRALTIELSSEENLPKTTTAPEIEDFVNKFLPEIIPQFNNLNSMVRVLAGRLLVDMVRACAGLSLADDQASTVSGSRHISSGVSECGTLAASKMEADDDDDEEEDAFSDAASHAPTEVASINSAMTIAGMDPALATKMCSALQGVLTRLWPSILELSSDQLKQSPAYATQLTAITKSVVRVLGDTFLRRALLTDVDRQVDNEEDDEVMEQQSPTAAQILAAANTASRTLVSCPNCSLARLGLRLSRLLVAFIGRSVYVSDIVVNIQSVHESHKRRLRFVVKALVEKLLKKASVQALQSLMDPSYHKIIRNSAKLQTRRERKRAAATEGSSSKGNKGHRDEDGSEGDDDEIEKASRRSGRPASLRAASVKSFGAASATSTVSQARRVHLECLNDILAPSSDEEDAAPREKTQNADAKPKPAAEPPRRRGLAAELETAASVAGLSRRSRRLMRSAGGDQSSTDEDEDDSDEGLSLPPRRPRVRFADEAEQPARKKRKRTASTGGFSTWLVEDTGTEVLDLAEPEALARHTAVASSANMARLTHAQRQGALGSAAVGSKRARLVSLPCFPERDGRLVIEESTVDKQTEHDDWLLPDDQQAGTPASASIAAAAAAAIASLEKKTAKSSLSRPGAIYRSARAQGDMKKPGLPEPFAYVPLGAGVSAAAVVGKRKRKNKAAVANEAERRLLLRSMGAGKMKGTKKAVKTLKGSSKPSSLGRKQKSKKR